MSLGQTKKAAVGKKSYSRSVLKAKLGADRWPVQHMRHRPVWFPARYRLIGLVRASADSFVLPPAVVRKATWRE